MPEITAALRAATDRVNSAVEAVRDIVGDVNFVYTDGSESTLTIPGIVRVEDYGDLDVVPLGEPIPEELDDAAIELLHSLECYGSAATADLVERINVTPTGEVDLAEATRNAIMIALTAIDNNSRDNVFTQLDQLPTSEISWLIGAVTGADAIALTEPEIGRVAELVAARVAQFERDDVPAVGKQLIAMCASQLAAPVSTDTAVDAYLGLARRLDGDARVEMLDALASWLLEGIAPDRRSRRQMFNISGAALTRVHAERVDAGAPRGRMIDLRAHRAAPAELIVDRVGAQPDRFRQDAARQPNCPTEILAGMWEALRQERFDSEITATYEAQLLVEHPNCPAEILDELARSRSVDVRHLVAGHSSTPAPTLINLANRAPSRVQRAAMGHQRIAEMYGYGGDDYQRWTDAIGADYRGTPAKLAAQLDAAN